MSDNRFLRFIKIIGEEKFNDIKTKTVMVIGIGGVGGYAVEALVRSGIGNIIIVDNDKVDETNINRQIIALDNTIDKLKVDITEKRIKSINNDCIVTKLPIFVNIDNLDEIFKYEFDYLVDACDTVTTKCQLIKECSKKNINLISCLGTGNKFDPEKLTITTLNKTINDPLARVLRKYVKDEGINKKIMVLASSELPIKINDRTPGSTSFVPSSAGLLIASYIIRKIIRK